MDGLVLLRVGILALALQSFEGATADDGDVVTGEFVLVKELAHLQFDEFDELRVFHHVDLVQVYDHGWHLHLFGQENVLAGLGHGPVVGGDDEDGAVHLGRAGDHVLDVVGMARTVDVGVVAFFGLILDVGDGDGDAALALFGRLIDAEEVAVLGHLLEG